MFLIKNEQGENRKGIFLSAGTLSQLQKYTQTVLHDNKTKHTVAYLTYFLHNFQKAGFPVLFQQRGMCPSGRLNREFSGLWLIEEEEAIEQEHWSTGA